MRRTVLLLFASVLWSPLALAFPPCPGAGLVVLPIETTASPAAEWATVRYSLHGHSGVRAALDASLHLAAGKCRDDDILPLPQPNGSDGKVGLPAKLAPVSGFGVIALPALDALSQAGGRVEHTLRFSVGSMQRLRPGEWVDVAQLQLREAQDDWKQASAIYRVRRRHDTVAGTLQLIETRAPLYPSKVAITERVVAEVALPDNVSTPVALRWRQTVSVIVPDPCSWGCETFPVEPPPETMAMPSLQHDAVAGRVSAKTRVARSSAFSFSPSSASEVEVAPPVYSARITVEFLGPGGQVLYATDLPGRWADLLTMGLLDFSASLPQQEAERIGTMRLEIQRLP